MDKLLLRTLLYDFYGELLTERQRTTYERYFFEDMSLNEIASEMGTSAQAVWDLLRRTEKVLKAYDSKLRLVEKNEEKQKIYAEIENILDGSDCNAGHIKARLAQLRNLE